MKCQSFAKQPFTIVSHSISGDTHLAAISVHGHVFIFVPTNMHTYLYTNAFYITPTLQFRYVIDKGRRVPAGHDKPDTPPNASIFVHVVIFFKSVEHLTTFDFLFVIYCYYFPVEILSIVAFFHIGMLLKIVCHKKANITTCKAKDHL